MLSALATHIPESLFIVSNTSHLGCLPSQCHGFGPPSITTLDWPVRTSTRLICFRRTMNVKCLPSEHQDSWVTRMLGEDVGEGWCL